MPAPAAGEALVRVHRVGICGTDLHAYEGKQTFFTYPRVLGHELAVEVLAVGEGVEHVGMGSHCAVEPYLNCERCAPCRRGFGNACEHMQTLGVHVDGGMRETMLVPARKLHPSARLNFDELVLVEPLCIGAHAVSRAALAGSDTVLVIGAGPIGLAVIEALRRDGIEPAVLEISPARIAFCRSATRIERVVQASAESAARVRDCFAGELPTAVFDCTGSPRSMAIAFDYVAGGGKLVFVGHFPGDIMFHDPEFHRREMTLLGSRNALPREFRRVIAALESGGPPAWTTRVLTPAELPAAFPNLLDTNSGLIKPIVQW